MAVLTLAAGSSPRSRRLSPRSGRVETNGESWRQTTSHGEHVGTEAYVVVDPLRRTAVLVRSGHSAHIQIPMSARGSMFPVRGSGLCSYTGVPSTSPTTQDKPPMHSPFTQP